MLLLGLEACAE